jgi:hypothetical protein
MRVVRDKIRYRATIEKAGFKVHGAIRNFYRVTAPNGDEGIIMRQSGSRWHFFWAGFVGTASGHSPETCMNGGLGDAIDTDAQLRSYCRMLINAPEMYLQENDSLYRASSDAFNS